MKSSREEAGVWSLGKEVIFARWCDPRTWRYSRQVIVDHVSTFQHTNQISPYYPTHQTELQTAILALSVVYKPVSLTCHRWNHEMNGPWYPWGQQPQLYVVKWREFVALLRGQAPSVSFAWCPNQKGLGYPWVGANMVQEGTPDHDLMDTNNDGQVRRAGVSGCLPSSGCITIVPSKMCSKSVQLMSK